MFQDACIIVTEQEKCKIKDTGKRSAVQKFLHTGGCRILL